MRPVSSAERDLLRGTDSQGPQYSIHKRLYLGDTISVSFDNFGHVLLSDVLGYDPIIEAVWSATSNQLCGEANFTLFAGRGGKRLTPFGIDLDINAGRANSIAPSPGRYIQLQTATVPRGSSPGADDWHRVFDGRIDWVDIGDSEIKLGCRDLMCDFVDRWVEHNDAGVYHGWWLPGGNLPIMLDDIRSLLFGPTDSAHIITGFGPVPPFTYPAFWQSPMSGGDALQAVASKVGEVLHMRYSLFSGEVPAVTRYNPSYDPGDLGVAYDSQLPWERISTTLRLDRRNVRNRLFGQYGPDRATRSNVGVFSVAEYGPRYLLFDEDQTSLINTEAEMDAMLALAAARLNTADVGSQIVRPYFWPVELSDPHTLMPDYHKFDGELDLRVNSYRHELTRQHDRTIITYADNASAAVRRLLTNRPKMVTVSLTDPVGMAPEGHSWGVADNLDPPGDAGPP